MTYPPPDLVCPSLFRQSQLFSLSGQPTPALINPQALFPDFPSWQLLETNPNCTFSSLRAFHRTFPLVRFLLTVFVRNWFCFPHSLPSIPCPLSFPSFMLRISPPPTFLLLYCDESPPLLFMDQNFHCLLSHPDDAFWIFFPHSFGHHALKQTPVVCFFFYLFTDGCFRV